MLVLTLQSIISISFLMSLSALLPLDAEVVEASILFEIICPSETEIPQIDISMFKVLPEQLTNTEVRVPEATLIYDNKNEQQQQPLNLGHTYVRCVEGRSEIPVEFRHDNLTRFIQESVGGRTDKKLEVLTWVRAVFAYQLPEGTAQSINDSNVLVATRLGVDIPPPTFRLVYKTSELKTGSLQQRQLDRPQDAKARQRRVQLVLDEMKTEQKDMRLQLQKLYERLTEKQKLRSRNNNVKAAATARLGSENRHNELIKVCK